MESSEQAEPQLTLLTQVTREYFPGVKFSKSALCQAGKMLKESNGTPETGEVIEKTLKFGGVIEETLLKSVCDFLKGKIGNLQPPVKVPILGMSRDFSEWPVSRAQQAIQRYIFGSKKDEIEDLPKPEKTKEGRDVWFAKTGVDTQGYTKAMGLNAIFDHAYNRREGELKKIERYNAKKAESLRRRNYRRAQEGKCPLKSEPPKSAYSEEGYLVHPPGINHNIYCNRDYNLRAVDPSVDGAILEALKRSQYNRDPNGIIPLARNRMGISEGSPGYIPFWQKPLVNLSSKRRRNYDKSPQWEILVIVQDGSDWAVFDIRGLLRDARWRKLVPKDCTISQLLDKFTADPVIDPQTRTATFTYKPEVIGITSRKVVGTTKAPSEMVKFLSGGPMVLITNDLGVTHPFATKVSIPLNTPEGLRVTCVDRFAYRDMPILDTLGQDRFMALRKAHDKLEEDIHTEAIGRLSWEQQEEVRRYQSQTSETTKARLLEATGLSESDIPWEEVKYSTTYIADALLVKDPNREDVWFTQNPKNSKSSKSKASKAKRPKRWDGSFAKDHKLLLSDETREALNNQKWEIKRSTPRYQKLAKTQLQLARKVRNNIIERAKRATGIERIGIVLEDLDMTRSFFHGRGKRSVGWSNLFVNKREGRWLMRVMYKVFTELATNRGYYVAAVDPNRTSITCTHCGHVNSDNRKGDHFCCLQCGFTANADIDIATDNIEQVALTGQPMPKETPREGSGSFQTPAPARKSETLVSTRDNHYPYDKAG